MRDRTKRLTVGPTLAALVLLILAPAQVAAFSGDSSLEGLLLDVGNRPAAGHRVLLIDNGGAVVAAADVAPDGLYRFESVSSGDYALGIENPEGRMARVQAPQVHLQPDRVARRDVKLMTANREEGVTANSGMGAWWGGLTAMAKIWTVVGIVVAGGLIYSALDDDEADASPI